MKHKRGVQLRTGVALWMGDDIQFAQTKGQQEEGVLFWGLPSVRLRLKPQRTLLEEQVDFCALRRLQLPPPGKVSGRVIARCHNTRRTPFWEPASAGGASSPLPCTTSRRCVNLPA